MTSAPFLPLTSDERRELLRVARQSIDAALHAHAAPECAGLTATLNEPGAAFVSLHHEQRLRGCIGTLTAEQPLIRAVARMAISAAFDDPRFPPLAENELAGLEIEISRLSVLTPARPDDIDPSRHGVCITAGEHRGVFLPQVAQQYCWDRDTLLTELCRKAQLPPEAWKHSGTSLMLFEAEVFSDERTLPSS